MQVDQERRAPTAMCQHPGCTATATLSIDCGDGYLLVCRRHWDEHVLARETAGR